MQSNFKNKAEAKNKILSLLYALVFLASTLVPPRTSLAQQEAKAQPVPESCGFVLGKSLEAQGYGSSLNKLNKDIKVNSYKTKDLKSSMIAAREAIRNISAPAEAPQEVKNEFNKLLALENRERAKLESLMQQRDYKMAQLVQFDELQYARLPSTMAHLQADFDKTYSQLLKAEDSYKQVGSKLYDFILINRFDPRTNKQGSKLAGELSLAVSLGETSGAYRLMESFQNPFNREGPEVDFDELTVITDEKPSTAAEGSLRDIIKLQQQFGMIDDEIKVLENAQSNSKSLPVKVRTELSRAATNLKNKRSKISKKLQESPKRDEALKNFDKDRHMIALLKKNGRVEAVLRATKSDQRFDLKTFSEGVLCDDKGMVSAVWVDRTKSFRPFPSCLQTRTCSEETDSIGHPNGPIPLLKRSASEDSSKPSPGRR